MRKTTGRKYYVCFKSGFCLIEAVILRSMVKVYLIVIEGEVECNDICLQQRDAVEIDESFCIKTLQGAHVILFDMAREVYFQE